MGLDLEYLWQAMVIVALGGYVVRPTVRNVAGFWDIFGYLVKWIAIALLIVVAVAAALDWVAS